MVILTMSISTSLFIISVALIRILKLNFMAKVHRLFLWCGVVFNLLIPWRLSVKYNIFSLFQYLKNMLEKKWVYIGGTDFTQKIGKESINVQTIGIISLIWVIGFCTVATYFLYTHIRYRKLYKQALPTENLYVNEWRRKNELRRKITILVSDRIVTPLTYGLLKPIIILPKMVLELDQRQIEYILNHEKIHVRQYHIILKWMSALSVCVHWFNPIVWLADGLVNKDIELSCDEQVLWELQEEDKKKYALLLIQLEAVRSNCFPLCNSFCRNLCEERISAIMKNKKLSKHNHILAGLVVIMFLAVFSTVQNGKNKNEGLNDLNIEQMFPKFDSTVINENDNNTEIPTLEFRRDEVTGKFSVQVKDKNDNIILTEEDIIFEGEETIEQVYEKILWN